LPVEVRNKARNSHSVRTLRERQREGESKREGRDRETERERERAGGRERERQRERESGREGERDRQRDRETESKQEPVMKTCLAVNVVHCAAVTQAKVSEDKRNSNTKGKTQPT
jgi:hypothetical protein